MSKIQKYVPLRRCMACNEQKGKKELIRIVRNKDGILEIDLSGKKNGRGAYICKNEECLNKIKKSKRLEKVLNINIEESFYESIRGVIIG